MESRHAWVALAVLVGCGGPASVGARPAVAPIVDEAFPPYDAPGDLLAFDLSATREGPRIYGLVGGGAERSLLRFDLDASGRASRAAPVVLGRGPMGDAVAIAVAAVGDRDLVVVCDQSADGARRYAASWVEANGRVVEAVDLGAFEAEEDVPAECFVRVARGGEASAVVVIGRDSVACPREASTDDIEQCLGYRGVVVAPGRAPEELFRVGADAVPQVAGSAQGWAWGLGPFPFTPSLVVEHAAIALRRTLIDGDGLEALMVTPDTLVAFVTEGPGSHSMVALRGSTILTGGAPDGYGSVPVVPCERALACVEGRVTATVTAGALQLAVPAGEDGTSVPWAVFLGAGGPAAAADGRVYAMDEDGALDILSCETGQPEARAAAWLAP